MDITNRILVLFHLLKWYALSKNHRSDQVIFLSLIIWSATSTESLLAKSLFTIHPLGAFQIFSLTSPPPLFIFGGWFMRSFWVDRLLLQTDSLDYILGITMYMFF